MEILLLGPVQAVENGAVIPLAGAKQRAVLAMLALETGRPVSRDRLVEGLWGERLPPSAGKMVQQYVWQLRKLLGASGGAEIVTRGPGYELRLERDRVDVLRFERLLADAAGAADAAAAGATAREALALWRGPPVADLVAQPFAAAEMRRLEELRGDAVELAIEGDLAAGRDREVIAEIDVLVAEYPLREGLHAQRMLALYRCGRQAEALEAYQQARRALVELIGIEPGPELRRLHDAVLRQDADLELEPRAPELPPALDTAAAPPIVGRDAELAQLRSRWARARRGEGTLVALVGARGMGKTRLAAELAADAVRQGAAVLYASGGGSGEAELAAVAGARTPRRPTLLIVDAADRAGAEVTGALEELAQAVAALRVLALVTGQDAAALGRLGGSEMVTLLPLDVEGVREIAVLYAAGADAAAVPVEQLLGASMGVPRRVHELASEWAREAAARRIEAVAVRAATSRGELRSFERELAGQVVNLQRARERAELFAGDDAAGAAGIGCPFKGLASFGVQDAGLFFGRERLVAELVARLAGEPLMGIVGPSGCGKSSVLRAGLVPALAAGVLPGSERWAVALVRPGEHPLDELERTVAATTAGRPLVVAVDQFEETFTLCRGVGERAAFVDALVSYAQDPRALVLLVVRADFYGRCAAYPELSRLLGANQVLVGPMRRDELRRAVERPAARAGLRVEPELVDELIADVEGEPGALPLLSTALLELWEGREGRFLRLAAYERTGGVRGAVARLAEGAFERLDRDGRRTARSILLRLADDGEGTAVVRRRVPLAELDADREAHVRGALAELTDRRLLTASEDTVEVAHEALLHEWPRLRGWLEEDADGRRLHRRLRDAAGEWDAGGRDPGELYRGARLAAALDWAADHDADLNDRERAFVAESRAASGRAHRRLRVGFLTVAGLQRGCSRSHFSTRAKGNPAARGRRRPVVRTRRPPHLARPRPHASTIPSRVHAPPPLRRSRRGRVGRATSRRGRPSADIEPNPSRAPFDGTSQELLRQRLHPRVRARTPARARARPRSPF